MAWIHLDKSVITFHVKEMIEDGCQQDLTALLGLGAVLVGPVVVRSLLQSLHQRQRPIALSDWITQAQQTAPAPTLRLAPAAQNQRPNRAMAIGASLQDSVQGTAQTNNAA